jgi:hypothetical protein
MKLEVGHTSLHDPHPVRPNLVQHKPIKLHPPDGQGDFVIPFPAVAAFLTVQPDGITSSVQHVPTDTPLNEAFRQADAEQIREQRSDGRRQDARTLVEVGAKVLPFKEHDFELQAPTAGFPGESDGTCRSARPAADDGYRVSVAQGRQS